MLLGGLASFIMFVNNHSMAHISFVLCFLIGYSGAFLFVSVGEKWGIFGVFELISCVIGQSGWYVYEL